MSYISQCMRKCIPLQISIFSHNKGFTVTGVGLVGRVGTDHESHIPLRNKTCCGVCTCECVCVVCVCVE